MGKDSWWRDPKFNDRLDDKGKLDFSEMYKKFEQEVANPLAPILGMMYKNSLIESEKEVQSNTEYRYLQIKSKIFTVRGTGRVKKIRLEGVCLGQDKLIPSNQDALEKESYNGYTIKRKEKTNRIYVRRFKDTYSSNSMIRTEFGDRKVKAVNSIMGKLLLEVKNEKLNVRDMVSIEVAKYLHWLWYNH